MDQSWAEILLRTTSNLFQILINADSSILPKYCHILHLLWLSVLINSMFHNDGQFRASFLGIRSELTTLGFQKELNFHLLFVKAMLPITPWKQRYKLNYVT